MTPFAHIDQTEFPLVIITFSGERPSEENFQAYLDHITKIYHREEPFIVVVDASQAVLPALKYQRQQAQWMADHLELIESYCRGTAYIIPNDIMRTLLKAIFAIQQQSVPYEIFATLEGGMAWAKSRLISA